mgnify:FL=1
MRFLIAYDTPPRGQVNTQLRCSQRIVRSAIILIGGKCYVLEGVAMTCTMMLDDAMVSQYLARIGWSSDVSVNRETLDGLVYAHQCGVPFETADLVAAGETPSLEIGKLFEKILADRHGGYCFELNKLFEALLRSLGFDARPCLSRAVRGREGRMPINHRGVLVFVDGVLTSVDVGFGGPLPAGSLALGDECEQTIRGEVYIPRRIDEHWWAIDRISQAKRDLYGDEGPSRRQTELELCVAAVEDIDFEALNLACSQPGTVFRDSVMANIRTANGFKSIGRGMLNVREFGTSMKTPLEDDAAVSAALLEHFGFSPYCAHL